MRTEEGREMRAKERGEQREMIGKMNGRSMNCACVKCYDILDVDYPESDRCRCLPHIVIESSVLRLCRSWWIYADMPGWIAAGGRRWHI